MPSLRKRLSNVRSEPLTVCSIATVVLLLCVLVTVVIIVWTMPDIAPVNGSSHICLQADEGVKCSETVSTLKNLLEKEIKIVYAQTRTQDNIDTKKYFEENVKIELKNDYLATIPDMKPAAKLVGLLTSSFTKDFTPNKMETVLAWFNGRDLDYTTGFMRYGMRYQNGRLIVPLTGTYNIYSFLSLTENSDTPEDRVQHANEMLIRHSMYKYNVKLGHDVELASSIQTRRQSANRNFNAFSSHISTLVQLEAGDEVSVKISDISLTSYPGDNFFGIHMI
ncbi:uncharacterized protein LOC127836355 [Dreissena polymorpha]|uniref:THD domain-containing protein n=1 Tax=Dreissena polymorpha TaxID=45954 RepID=A0A9D4JMT1_DREPO|nr:uncharacterized protein LOC127836355 [Dreissena polymorpha]KAH3814548.1 hypothetical protein DPMN_143050 [Dreissena polymorpha]